MRSLAELAADFAKKRKAFLAAHAIDFQSEEARSAYELSEEAEEELLDAIHTRAARDPDWIAGVLK
jgi:hypothetical protein